MLSLSDLKSDNYPLFIQTLASYVQMTLNTPDFQQFFMFRLEYQVLCRFLKYKIKYQDQNNLQSHHFQLKISIQFIYHQKLELNFFYALLLLYLVPK